MSEQEFEYFSSVEGYIVPRYGSSSFIGARKRPMLGFVWNTQQVVAIPRKDMVLYGKEYRRALKDGALIRRSVKDHRDYLESQKEPNLKAEAECKKLHAENIKAAGGTIDNPNTSANRKKKARDEEG